MRQWKTSLLILAMVVAGVAQQGTPLANPDVRRIGQKLGCQCGCQASLTECNMINCHFADPARLELLRRVLAGESEPAIINAFVERYGKVILRQPPEEGFFLLSWVTPLAGVIAGLGFLWWFIRRMRRPVVASAPQIEVNSEAYDRYRERIEKDLEKLDS
jgi:cytochrome c-type biogenesis protein CcmH/NrfF